MTWLQLAALGVAIIGFGLLIGWLLRTFFDKDDGPLDGQGMGGL